MKKRGYFGLVLLFGVACHRERGCGAYDCPAVAECVHDQAEADRLNADDRCRPYVVCEEYDASTSTGGAAGSGGWGGSGGHRDGAADVVSDSTDDVVSDGTDDVVSDGTVDVVSDDVADADDAIPSDAEDADSDSGE